MADIVDVPADQHWFLAIIPKTVRDRIYDLALPTETEINISGFDRRANGIPLLATRCKQIRIEVIAHFFTKNTFVADLHSFSAVNLTKRWFEFNFREEGEAYLERMRITYGRPVGCYRVTSIQIDLHVDNVQQPWRVDAPREYRQAAHDTRGKMFEIAPIVPYAFGARRWDHEKVAELIDFLWAIDENKWQELD